MNERKGSPIPKAYLHAEKVLNVFRGTNYTAVTGWIALYSVIPTESGGGTEVTGGGYARASVTFGAPAGTPRAIASTNEILITMPAVTVAGVGLLDAVTAGELKYPLDIVDKAFDAADQARFAVGGITITET